VGPIRGFGSVVVAGVHYEEAGAAVLDGDGQPLSNGALKLGVVASIDASEVLPVGGRLQAQAQTIRVAELLIGPVEGVNLAASTVQVLGQTVAVTAGTVFDTTLAGGLGAWPPGTVVAVHGQADSAGARVVATRIESRPGAAGYLVRGPLATVDRTTRRLVIGQLSVVAPEAVALPDALNAGDIVRIKLSPVHANGPWTATALRLDGSRVPDRTNIEIEGHVSAFVSPQQFSVDGVAVDAAAATAQGGMLALGVRVEVEGRSSAGVIVARRVSVDAEDGGGDTALEIEGRITALDTVARNFVVRGVTVNYAAGATFTGGTAADLALNRAVSVKGRLAADRSHVDATIIHVEL
jgi:hypothetical protein